MKPAIVSALSAFKEAFLNQFNANQFARAEKIINKNGYQVVKPTNKKESK